MPVGATLNSSVVRVRAAWVKRDWICQVGRRGNSWRKTFHRSAVPLAVVVKTKHLKSDGLALYLYVSSATG